MVKIGVHLNSLGLPFRKALLEASKLAVGGVKLDAVGDFAPGQLSQTGRRELRNPLRTYNLELTSCNCPLRRGLDVPEHLEARLEGVKQVMSLAFDLGPRIVTIQAGQVPEKEDDPRRAMLKEALSVLGGHGDRIGTTLALETGLESGETLAKFLAGLDTGSLGANFDPANLLINGFRPFEDLRALVGKVVQVQARDARRNTASRAAQELPLGHGELDWMGLLGGLEEIEHRGWVVVQREQGDNGLGDVQNGVALLRRIGA